MVFGENNLFDLDDPFRVEDDREECGSDKEEQTDSDLHAWMEELEMIRLQMQALTQRRRELEALVMSELSQREVKQYTLGRGRLRAIVSTKLVPVDINEFAQRFPELVRIRYEPDQRAINNQLQMQGGEEVRQYLKEETVITLKTDDRKSIPYGKEVFEE